MPIEKLNTDYLIYTPDQTPSHAMENEGYDPYQGLIVDNKGQVLYTVVDSTKEQYFGPPETAGVIGPEYDKSFDLSKDGKPLLALASHIIAPITLQEILQSQSHDSMAESRVALIGNAVGYSAAFNQHRGSYGVPHDTLIPEMKDFIVKMTAGRLNDITGIFPSASPRNDEPGQKS